MSMSNQRETKTTIEIPRKVLHSMIVAYQKWEEFSDEFEDFVFASSPSFIKKIRGARREHLQGKTRPMQELKKELG